jgi:hypothetical protein
MGAINAAPADAYSSANIQAPLFARTSVANVAYRAGPA